MNDKSIFQSVFSYVRTTHEASELINHIDLLSAKFYSVQKDPFGKMAYAALDPQVATAIESIFTERQLSWDHHEEVKAFLHALKSEIQRFDVLTITLSYRPTSEDITAFITWARTNLAPNILLETHVDPTLIGGAVIVYKGIYVDHTIKKRLDELFLKQGREILSTLK